MCVELTQTGDSLQGDTLVSLNTMFREGAGRGISNTHTPLSPLSLNGILNCFPLEMFIN